MSESAARTTHAAGARPAGLPRQALRLLIAGPRQVRPAGMRLAFYALIAAGAAAMVWSAVIHLRLWSEGYSAIPTIGPLFLAQGIGVIAIAAALMVVRRLALMLAGAVALAATAVGLLVSSGSGLFGFRESLAVPDARSSLVIEFAGAGILLAAAVVVAVAAWTAEKRGR